MMLTDEMIEWIRHTAILWIKNMGQPDLTDDINYYIDEDQESDINQAMYQEYEAEIA